MPKTIISPVVLVVLDGWGLREETADNGIALANSPFYDQLLKLYPFTQLDASGEAVGLPKGQMGNSEVGHTTIGAGCVIYQDLVRISADAKAGSLGHNSAFGQAFSHVKARNSQLHILGLLSAGGVHSHQDHLFETIKAAHSFGIKKIVVHPFLDGRDAPKTAGANSLEKLEQIMNQLPGIVIGSISGRFYAMDRDTNWDRTQKAFIAIFEGQAEHIYDKSIPASRIIREWYCNQIFDEHLEPMVFQHQGNPYQVKNGDALIFTNFRKDRTKQLSKLICNTVTEKDILFVTMTDYGSEIVAQSAYKPNSIEQTLAGVISDASLTQAHIAETEKFPHATYFLNGGRSEPYPGEEDVLIPSRKDIKTHDQAPEMRAKEIADDVIKRLDSHDFIFINFANPDMVGHTANQPAIITAIETVDRQLQRVTQATLAKHGALIIIADHGNAEVMVDRETNQPHTAHTTNPVPCLLVHQSKQPKLRSGGSLADVAPTVLDLLGLDKPKSMTGTSLFTS